MSKLSHRAMLMTLNIRLWKATATDRSVAIQAELSNSAESGTMTVIKKLAPKHVIAPIGMIARIGREEHYKLTLPGLVTGQHLLPTAAFERYMMTQREIKENFFNAVENFLVVYPEIVAKAPKRLGGANRASDFPSTTVIRSYFDYNYHPSPVPEVTDWRLDDEVSSVDQEQMRSEITASVEGMYAKATAEVFSQCQEWLEKLKTQAENYNVRAPGAMLRDATIENMQEFVDIVQSMNITGDPKLTAVIVDMRKFSKVAGEELRKSEEKRTEVADLAGSILAKINKNKGLAV